MRHCSQKTEGVSPSCLDRPKRLVTSGFGGKRHFRYRGRPENSKTSVGDTEGNSRSSVHHLEVTRLNGLVTYGQYVRYQVGFSGRVRLRAETFRPHREEHLVTETPDVETIAVANTDEALALVDRALGSFMQRELVSANEVTDVLLDIRSVLNRIDRPEIDVTVDISDVEAELEVPAQA